MGSSIEVPTVPEAHIQLLAVPLSLEGRTVAEFQRNEQLWKQLSQGMKHTGHIFQLAHQKENPETLLSKEKFTNINFQMKLFSNRFWICNVLYQSACLGL